MGRRRRLTQGASTGMFPLHVRGLACALAMLPCICTLPAIAGVAAVARGPSQALAGPPSRAATEADIIRLIERSEAGDVVSLRAASPGIVDRGLGAVVDASLAASRLDLPATRAARRVVEERRLPPRWRAMTLATEAGVAFATGDYGLCARDSAAWLSLPAATDPIHLRSDVAQMAAIAAQLAHLPGQRTDASPPSTSPTWRDKAGLVRTQVRIGGMPQDAVVDTGANLSVVSESAARRLGLATVDGGSVRSSSRDAVAVRLAVAKRLDIAGTTLSNVAFLVLRDEDLRLPLPGGYDIPAIVGFPVLRALGRVTFTPTSLTTHGDTPPSGLQAPLVASGSSLFVLAEVNGLGVPLHLDSGASATSLDKRFAAEHPDVVRGLETRSTRSAGAGGAVEGRAHVLRDAVIEIGGVGTSLPAVDIETSSPSSSNEAGNFGTLGQDVLRSAGGSYTIDFGRMTLSISRAARLSR